MVPPLALDNTTTSRGSFYSDDFYSEEKVKGYYLDDVDYTINVNTIPIKPYFRTIPDTAAADIKLYRSILYRHLESVPQFLVRYHNDDEHIFFGDGIVSTYIKSQAQAQKQKKSEKNKKYIYQISASRRKRLTLKRYNYLKVKKTLEKISGRGVDFITLTQAGYKDRAQLKRARNRFLIYLKRHYNIKYYIIKSEQQQRGSWHYHLILFDMPYLTEKEMKKLRDIWREGINVKFEQAKNIDHVLFYLVSYINKIGPGRLSWSRSLLQLLPYHDFTSLLRFVKEEKEIKPTYQIKKDTDHIQMEALQSVEDIHEEIAWYHFREITKSDSIYMQARRKFYSRIYLAWAIFKNADSDSWDQQLAEKLFAEAETFINGKFVFEHIQSYSTDRGGESNERVQNFKKDRQTRKGNSKFETAVHEEKERTRKPVLGTLPDNEATYNIEDDDIDDECDEDCLEAVAALEWAEANSERV